MPEHEGEGRAAHFLFSNNKGRGESVLAMPSIYKLFPVLFSYIWKKLERNDFLSSLVNDHLDNELLENQLKNLPTILSLYNAERKSKIKSVTCVSTLAEVFNAIPAAKIQCSKVNKMLKLYFTIPLTSATCERSLSAMQRLKTWLRVNAGANHLSPVYTTKTNPGSTYFNKNSM